MTRADLPHDIGVYPHDGDEMLSDLPDDLEAAPGWEPPVDGAGTRTDYIHETLFYVPSLARRYVGRGLTYDELVAAGNLGLVEAALRYDPARNVRFTTYANWWIRKSMIEALGHQFGPLRLPRYQYDRLKSVRDARSRWLASHGREPERGELATASGLPAEEVDRLLNLATGSVSLDQPLSPADTRPIKETIEDTETEHPQDSLERRDMTRRLRRQLAELEARERQVICLRYGLADGAAMTLRETGRVLGISRERVRQVELRALGKLKSLM